MSRGTMSQNRRILLRARKIVDYIDKKMEYNQTEIVDILCLHRFTLGTSDDSYLIRNEADSVEKVYSLLKEKGYRVSLPEDVVNSSNLIGIKPSKFELFISKE